MKKFNSQILQPYFKGVYADLLLRSAPPKEQKTLQVDKVTLVEFIDLPGILADRFYSITGNGSKTDARVHES